MHPLVDRLAAELLRSDVSYRLGEVPAVPTEVHDRVVAFAIFSIDGSVQHLRAELTSALAVGVDIIHADANEMVDAPSIGRELLATRVGDDHGSVGSDAELCTM